MNLLSCKKANQEINASFTVVDVEVEYPNNVIKNMKDSSEVIVDSSGVLLYTFNIETSEPLEQISVHRTHWGQSVLDNRFHYSLGEYFMNSGFDNSDVTFQVRIDLSDHPDASVERAIYPLWENITLQAFVKDRIYDGQSFRFTIVADSTLTSN